MFYENVYGGSPIVSQEIATFNIYFNDDPPAKSRGFLILLCF